MQRSEIPADVPVEEAAAELVIRLNALKPDVYLIWASEDVGWAVLPFLNPAIAALAVGHADSETYYVPVRHYRSFLTRVVGTTPEVCVGLVLSCVIDKERVEWISYDETGDDESVQKAVETYLGCFEKAIADAHAAPRQAIVDFPPLNTRPTESTSWLGKVKAKILK